MFETSVLEISKGALQKNLSFLKKIIKKDTIFSSVIKGNAYGHGIEKFVPIAEECGINHFSVFSADEAYRVKKMSNNGPRIMIMGMIDYHELKWAIENEIEFYVFEKSRLEAAINFAKAVNKKARIHIEVETGMNRTGFNQAQLKEIFPLLKYNSENLVLEGLCTHYAGAESIANFLRIKNQIKIFNKMHKILLKEGLVPKLRHTACSAAAITYPQTQMDLVRVGILQYGYWPSRETLINYLSEQENKVDPLERIIKWKSQVMSTKNVNMGEFIGYGTTYLAQREMKIATVPIGYSHGFSRSLSNTGRVLVNGHRVGVIGMVNMNLMTIDITDCPDVNIGDEVVMIGEQGGQTISVSSFSELSDQLNYELLTRLPQHIPRVTVA
ncbi:MAG: alanine racemase [Melioribacteraceae bacterium]|nr:alanine racemase [Melioribacteraceae bacterium]MCF8354722.1 alanine racemase [Melioribacteraceae bacterium]MCF8394351.1 alanine racemase [Melioribacteraceae bacterium]MCF8420061.1 alanine racemase [Melioribacteraceae bacterium]